MEIRIGAPVLAEDGEVGRVERIIVHPDTTEVEGVVATLGDTMARDVVIPIDRLLGADGDGLRVRGTVAELEDLDSFAQSQYVTPPEEWLPPTDTPASIYLFPASPLAVAAFAQPATNVLAAAHEVADLQLGDIDLSALTPVYCGDDEVGHVERVLTEGDRLVGLVVNRGSMFARSQVVPVEQVRAVGEDGVRLALSRDDLDDLPALVEDETAEIETHPLSS